MLQHQQLDMLQERIFSRDVGPIVLAVQISTERQVRSPDAAQYQLVNSKVSALGTRRLVIMMLLYY